MNINWVLANSTQIDPTTDLARLKALGSFWGGWRTWRSCQTDNVICHDVAKAAEMVKRKFHETCNFYIPQAAYVMLERPSGVKIYQGDFTHDVDNHEDIVAMHLTASVSDIVLLLGFDLSQQDKHSDKFQEHKRVNYYNLIRQVIKDNQQVQWVIVDHAKPLQKPYLELGNLTQDTLDNVTKLGL